MKKFLKIVVIVILLTILIYVSNIANIPDKIILFEGEKLKVKLINGLNIEPNDKYKSALVSYSIDKNVQENTSKKDYSLKLLNTFLVKSVTAYVIPKTKVIPVGDIVGFKLYTKGVLVVGLTDKSNNCGIEEGDVILSVNENEVSSTEELIDNVNNQNGLDVEIKFDRNGEIKTANIKPSKTEEGAYKLGLWVRDAAAGVGTITYYEPESKMFVALGHGIQDVDTEKLITIQNGEIVKASIINIEKGEKNTPGEIRGNITNGKKIGMIYKNTAFGVYGVINDESSLNLNSKEAIDVASREEIKEGPAKIICTLEDGIRKEYNIEIKKIYIGNTENNKSMLIKIIDDELISKTGGIIQGMSGSPIIQNGKLVGAVTHVLVQNPTEGYAIFADMMIKQMREVE